MKPKQVQSSRSTLRASVVFVFAALGLRGSIADDSPVRLPSPSIRVAMRDAPLVDTAASPTHPKIIGFTPESTNPPQTFEPIEASSVDSLADADELSSGELMNLRFGVPVHSSSIGTAAPANVDWWTAQVVAPVGIAPATIPISIDSLVRSSLVNSFQVRALRAQPEVRRATVAVECAAFDWTAFVESRFDDTSDPIGNTLQTGAVDGRYIDQTWAASAGLRRTNRIGGKTEITQNGGHQRNNSQFLIPNPQGTTRLELNYTQPLLAGSGTFVNESRIVLAKMDYRATDRRTAAQIQDHLIQVTDAYWDLYLARSHLLQKRKLLASAIRIYETLAAREGVDVLRRQILRAQVAVTGREAEVIRFPA